MNAEIREARRVVAEYKRLNEKTIEKMVRNPNGKGYILEKVVIDENAKLFKPKPKKQINSKPYSSSKTPKAIKPAKRVKKVAKTLNEKKAKLPVLPKSPKMAKEKTLSPFQLQIIELLKEGKTHDEMAVLLGAKISNIRNASYEMRKRFSDLKLTRKNESITEDYRPNSDLPAKILKLMKKGKTNREICRAFKITIDSARAYTRRLRKEYPSIKPVKSVRELTPESLANKELFEQALSYKEIAAIRKKALATIYNSYAFLTDKLGHEWHLKVEQARRNRKQEVFDKYYGKQMGL